MKVSKCADRGGIIKSTREEKCETTKGVSTKPGDLAVDPHEKCADRNAVKDSLDNPTLSTNANKGKLECNVRLEERKIECHEEPWKCTNDKSCFEDNKHETFESIFECTLHEELH